MTSIKLNYKDITRRIALGDIAAAKPSYDDLISTTIKLFSIDTSSSPELLWTDEEGDVITVSSQLELDEALRIMHSRAVLKFTVKAAGESLPATPTPAAEGMHPGVSCDGCGMSPILGARFKCTGRDDYDLCEACEAKGPQPFPMTKIATPQQPRAGMGMAWGRGGRGGGRCGGGRGWRGMGWGGCDWKDKLRNMGDIVMDATIDPELSSAIKASLEAFTAKMDPNFKSAGPSASADGENTKMDEKLEDIIFVEEFATWAPELTQLADMGFSDAVVLVPLLKRFLGAFKDDSANKPSYSVDEGLQRVVAEVLKVVPK